MSQLTLPFAPIVLSDPHNLVEAMKEADKAASPADDGIHEELSASTQNGRPGSESAAAPEAEEAPGAGPAAVPISLSPLLPPPLIVVVALDATRDHRGVEVRMSLRALVARGDILRGGDSLLVLGVLHSVTNPSEGGAPPLGVIHTCLLDDKEGKIGLPRLKMVPDIAFGSRTRVVLDVGWESAHTAKA
ncbi:Cysteine-rich receptor-like protein kinase 25 [Hordeum vulgare]|nr:Cysteine-rich receptor-like protein kinase 25 [Hordeum vulgare]